MIRVLHVVGFYDCDKYYRINYYIEGIKAVYKTALITSTKKWGIENNDYEEVDSNIDGYRMVRIKPIFDFNDFVLFHFKKKMRDFRPHVVHLYDAKQMMPLLVARQCKIDKIPYIYEHEQREKGGGWLGKIRYNLLTRWAIKYICKNASLIRVANTGAKDLIIDECGSKIEEKIREEASLFYSDKKNYRSDELRFKYRTDNNYDKKDVLFGITANVFYEKKAIEHLVYAFMDIDTGYNKLIIQGKFTADYYKKIKKLADKDHRIRINNYTLNAVQLNTLLNALDYAIYTSPTNSFFEALGSGTPVIVPFGSVTEKLQNKNIYKYGDKGCIDYRSNMIKDPAVRHHIRDVLLSVPRNVGKILPPVEYSQSKFIETLSAQYVALSKL